MIKKVSLLFFLLNVVFGFSQGNSLWHGYFSYNKITDLSESANAIYASTDNALFKKNLSTDDLSTINSINGLKMNNISAMYHSDTVNKTFIGNTKGELVVVNGDGSILIKNGILTEVPVAPTIKKINHFTEYQNKIYVSTDYGISVFDLSTMEFGDSYFMGNSGQSVKVYQTAVLNGDIYAATDINGIKKASLSNTNLVDYSQWQTFDSGYWNGITTFQNQLIATNLNNNVYKYNGSGFTNILILNQSAIEIRATTNNLIITTLNNVYVYDSSLIQVAHIQSGQFTSAYVTFTCATVINNSIFIGTNENGVLNSTISSPSTFEVIRPNGPFINNVFRLKKSSSTLWAVYGTYSRGYNPYIPNGPNLYPISKYNSQTGWDLIPTSTIFGAKSLSNITLNPNNDKQVFISSYFSGLLKLDDELPSYLYNNSNTGSNGLESLQASPIDIRVNGPAYDKNGNLWMTNNMISKPLKVFRSNGQWQSYTLIGVASITDTSYGVLQIDKNNTKWLSYNNGLVGFNENYNNKTMNISMGTSGNLPSFDVRCTAVDNKNQLWIGTAAGLRYIPSVDSFLTETDIQTKNIVINENINGQDLAQELFYDQFIQDIAVDGANRKWVSIVNSGVYLVSYNGQETIYHFTKDNSPLPSDIVNDIEIDGVTGEVFFATDNGLVSFKGSATTASDNLNNVYVYPNPVRPEYDGTVKISGLTNKAVVKITDVGGNLVYETTSQGGTIEWDTTAFGKYKVATGVYVILVSAEDGGDTTVNKVMIIR